METGKCHKVASVQVISFLTSEVREWQSGATAQQAGGAHSSEQRHKFPQGGRKSGGRGLSGIST